MRSVLQYIFSEVKNKRLQKSQAIDLIRHLHANAATDKPPFIHPLLQENISSLFEQQYGSTFTGREFFLADHVVRGERVMPGVAYLEMARAAVAQAAGITDDGQRGIQLKNVVWVRPIVVGDEGAQVRIGLFPENERRISYEIYSEAGSGGGPVVYSNGRAVLSSSQGNRNRHAIEAPALDLQGLRAECSQDIFSSAQCYEAFRSMGMEYGPGHRGLQEIHIGRGQALAEVCLPACIANTREDYVLHPSLMDSTLQASLGLMNGAVDGSPVVPFALEELEILGPCSSKMWAFIRLRQDSPTAGKMRKLDIDLCDEAGRICVRMKSLTLRVLQSGVGAARVSPPVTEPKPESVGKAVSAPVDNEGLQARVLATLMHEVCNLLKVKIDDIDPDTELLEYGFDSIILTQFGNTFNQEYKLELAPTIFFEHPTIRSFASYLVKEHHEVFSSRFAPGVAAEPMVQVEEQNTADDVPSQKQQRSRFIRAASGPESAPPAIAIVGMSGRFPMANDLHEFWRNLLTGRDCIVEIPKERWDWREYYGDPREEGNKTKIKWGGFIEGIDEFDPMFFGISPREAETMDPQQRLLMMYVWKAIEDAGYSPESLSGTRTAIFVGTTNSGYMDVIAKAAVSIEGYSSTGVLPSVGPNRMSYFLNLHGPSEPIETACSSSLIAIHRAIEAIANGSCEMAIVGGINTIVTPAAHISFNKAGMLSEDGKCKSFSDKANGYVRGEGIGMLLLKKLHDAEQAEDHIYGIIRSSAENHGGRSNSLTAPNPKAQAELIKTAYTKAGIDPRTVSYIEAHGTGTGLGDPVEVNGLKTAFKELYRTTGDSDVVSAHCGLGSVKSNIGHLEVASGIAGVIKVLLQLQHKTLVKTLHCETINPYIDLNRSPFYIVRETQEWKALTDGDGKLCPRRAGVSSFGFGGANAHVVIEEYVPPPPSPGEQVKVTQQNPAIIVLSARNEDRLKDQARQILSAIGDGEISDSNLGEVAYTLQVGREGMEERLGLIAGSVKQVEAKLQDFLGGKENVDHLYRGQLRRNKNALAVFNADEELQKAIAKKEYSKVLDLWVKGLIFDWNRLYEDGKPRRMSLPSYPFARARYWPEGEAAPAGAKVVAAAIHPLLQRNTSDLSEQRFSSVFTGREFFLADHVVKEERVLPAVAYLEMARAAVVQAAGTPDIGLELTNIVWARPIIAGTEGTPVHIGVFPENDGYIAYEVYSASENNGAPIVHSQGRARENTSVSAAPTLNLASLQAKCTQASLNGTECYEAFRAIGINYGPGHRGIQELYAGNGQVLARLSLPVSVADTQDEYVLHPSMMDSALQASIGLMTGVAQGKVVLPFALEELVIFGRCTASMWVLVRSSDKAKSDDHMRKLDFDLCDEAGRICVRMKGFTFRLLQLGVGSVGVPAAIETVIFKPRWREQAVREQASSPAHTSHLVMLCELDNLPHEDISRDLQEARCVTLTSRETAIDKRFMSYAWQAFQEIQAILREKPREPILIQVVAPGRNEAPLCSGLSGLLKTAQMENPKILGQMIEVAAREDAGRLVTLLKENSRIPLDNRIRYEDGKRLVAGWHEVEITGQDVWIPWKEAGVYLITGGAGGLGIIFVEEIARQAKHATLILTGRSALSQAKQVRLKELEDLGVDIKYKEVDVTDRTAVKNLFESIEREIGRLDGIVHAAGVIQDNFMVKKTKEEFEAVLPPKVTGLVNLDEASKDLPLDFLAMFSSSAGAIGNIGQADYATANAFMDSYAQYRNALVASKQRHGQTLSINWPLWQEGGMRLDAETEKMMRQTTGLIPMRTATGIRCFYQGLASGESQVMVMEGSLARVRQKLLATTDSTPTVTKLVSPRTDSAAGIEGLQDKVLALLMRSVSKLLKVKLEDIDPDTELIEYGFDSITLTQFGNTFNQEYQLELTPTVFFEHTTLRSFARYLIENHRDAFASRLSVPASIESAAGTWGKVLIEESPLPQKQRSRSTRIQTVELRPAAPPAIAIVGMSGQFPMARDLKEFWQNLVEGKDCIVEIPEERWDWRECYGDPAKEANKTNIKWGGFIDAVYEFDPSFFGISPQEALRIDPQQRLLMMYVWKAIEDAGYSAETLSGTRTAIFVGTRSSGYSEMIVHASVAIEGGSSTGSLPSVGPNRMSYFLNLHGPSEPIETACSSSLIAIHRAMRAIADGDCDMAIVGGINTIVNPAGHISFSKAGMLCEDGRCKSFSNKANGYVRGEGVGMLFLKKLQDAEQARDHIYGVIRASGQNHGGRANSLTAPNPRAQAELLKTVYTKAGIDPRTVTYIEAHGTGTELGDPVEISGLKNAFKELYEATGEPKVVNAHCGVGSVKSNIGYLELASGIAGVIKVLLQLKHKTLVKSLHCETLSPYIDLKESPFYIVQETKEWQALRDEGGKTCPRRAGVSSFGFGGVNAHIVIEEYIPPADKTEEIQTTSQNPAIIVLSARNEERLKDQVRQLLTAIDEKEIFDGNLADAAYTLQLGRVAMEERLGLIATSVKQLQEKLQGFLEGKEDLEGLYRGQLKPKKNAAAVFAADEDMAKAIDAWIAKAKYTKLLDLWVKGLFTDWSRLHVDSRARRISLPTYVFAKERYWISFSQIKSRSRKKERLPVQRRAQHG
jgi:polyketide synthase PksN